MLDISAHARGLDTRAALQLAMSVWLLVAIGGLAYSATPVVVYAYVAGVPVAFFAALFLGRFASHLVTFGVIIVCAVGQWLYLSQRQAYIEDQPMLTLGGGITSSLGAAAFILEEHPELLAPGQRLFATWGPAANADQHARGKNRQLIVPGDMGDGEHSGDIYSPDEAWQFVRSYPDLGVILADWLMIGSETLKGEGREFFARLARDSNVDWITVVRDSTGHEIWIGTVIEGTGRPLAEAPVRDAAPLVFLYHEKYNRWSFLTRNVLAFPHY